MTAREYWKQRFGKEPKTDMDKLAVAFASEYGRVAYNQALDDLMNEVEKSSFDVKIKEAIRQMIEILNWKGGGNLPPSPK